eukprot:TRINITY_DN60031_c0_g1_i1.p1 TRINITY_DN60031_c0_g1~~TRINITY_DN60031_c0_g1_i1.p1  ORF type:complete len:216 (+),score=24.33 TRINITY_DN60031_c0_g1_i1:122-769(+)
MASSIHQLVASVAEGVYEKLDPSKFICKAVHNKVIITWLLCIQRSRSLKNTHPQGSQEPSHKRARVDMFLNLPNPAVDLLRAHLGTLQDMGAMVLPAKVLKLRSDRGCAVQRAKLQAWLACELRKEVEPQLMKIADSGALEGKVLVPKKVVAGVNQCVANVRGNRQPGVVVLDALRSEGYTTSDERWIVSPGTYHKFFSSSHSVNCDLEITLKWH